MNLLNTNIDSVNWSNVQRELLTIEPNLAILGAAGTGKTLLALALAKARIEAGDKVLFVSFTKSISSFMRAVLMKNNANGVMVTHAALLHTFKHQKFDIVLVDEIQDFTTKEILDFLLLSNNGVYLFGDLEQDMYSIKDNKELIRLEDLNNIDKLRIEYLKENYRVPSATVECIKSIYGGKNESVVKNIVFEKIKDHEFPRNAGYVFTSELRLPTMSKQIESNKFSARDLKPKILRFEDYTQEIEWIAEFLKNNTRYNNIGVLLKRNDTMKNGYIYKHKVVKDIVPGVLETKRLLEEKGILVSYKYKNENCLDFDKECNINILTIHSSKGLEFDCVILPFYGWTNRSHHFNIPYVAFTRASERLIVTYSNVANIEVQLLEESLIDGVIEKRSKDDEQYSDNPNLKMIQSLIETAKRDSFYSWFWE